MLPAVQFAENPPMPVRGISPISIDPQKSSATRPINGRPENRIFGLACCCITNLSLTNHIAFPKMVQVWNRCQGNKILKKTAQCGEPGKLGSLFGSGRGQRVPPRSNGLCRPTTNPDDGSALRLTLSYISPASQFFFPLAGSLAPSGTWGVARSRSVGSLNSVGS